MTNTPNPLECPTQGEALKPCPNPWCESHARPERNYRPFVQNSRASLERAVSCPVCPMRGPWRDTEAEAVAAWNQRHTSALEKSNRVLAAENERLRESLGSIAEAGDLTANLFESRVRERKDRLTWWAVNVLQDYLGSARDTARSALNPIEQGETE